MSRPAALTLGTASIATRYFPLVSTAGRGPTVIRVRRVSLSFQLSNTPSSVDVRLMATPCGYHELAASLGKHQAPIVTLLSSPSTAVLSGVQPVFHVSVCSPSAAAVAIDVVVMPWVPSATRPSISWRACGAVGCHFSLNATLIVSVSPGWETSTAATGTASIRGVVVKRGTRAAATRIPGAAIALIWTFRIFASKSKIVDKTSAI
jgi:hypothetical protein